MKWKWTDDDKTLWRTSDWINGVVIYECFRVCRQRKGIAAAALQMHRMCWRNDFSRIALNAINKMQYINSFVDLVPNHSWRGDERFIEMPRKVFNACDGRYADFMDLIKVFNATQLTLLATIDNLSECHLLVCGMLMNLFLPHISHSSSCTAVERRPFGLNREDASVVWPDYRLRCTSWRRIRQ